MILSFIVFWSILCASILFSRFPLEFHSNNRIRIYDRTHDIFISKYIFIIIFITILIGLRYKVGTDWEAYTIAYDRTPTSSLREAITFPGAHEWLYTSIVFFLKKSGLPNYSIFISSTLIILAIYYLTYKEYPKLLPYGLFTLFTLDTFFLFLNIMRQAIAFFIILYSIKYIFKRKPLHYVLFIIIAAGFHMTAYLLLPFYALAYKPKLYISRWIVLALYVFTWAFGDILFGYLLNLTSYFLDNQYVEYANKIESLQMTVQSGLGLLMLHIIDIIIIICSQICYKHFSKIGYSIYYNIFIVGVLIQNIAGLNMLMARVPFCMTSMRLIVGAFTLYLGLHGCLNVHRLRIKVSTTGLLSIIFILCALSYFIGNCMRFDYSFIFGHH